jgi:hypothetical protein
MNNLLKRMLFPPHVFLLAKLLDGPDGTRILVTPSLVAHNHFLCNSLGFYDYYTTSTSTSSTKFNNNNNSYCYKKLFSILLVVTGGILSLLVAWVNRVILS